MKSHPRSTAALGALVALCIAAPAAVASKPDGERHTPTIPAPAADHASPNADHGAREGNQPVQGVDQPAAPAMDDTGAADSGSPHTDDHGTPPPAPAGCDRPDGTQVFLPWKDRKSYVETTDGGLEAGADGWTLADGAATVEGNEPFLVGGATDHRSLSLPAGSSATTPVTCFAAQNSSFRLFARTSGDRRSRLEVEVLYTNGNGHNSSRVAGRLRGGDAWRPSKRLSLAIGRAKGRGRLGHGGVAFRFTPVGAGDWQIDDLYLDPRARH